MGPSPSQCHDPSSLIDPPQPRPADPSRVFRQAHALSTGDPLSLEFDDPSLESAATLRAFLALIIHLTLPFSSPSSRPPTPAANATLAQTDTLAPLLLFLEKYDCPAPRTTLLLLLTQAMPSTVHPAAALLAGCMVDEPRLVEAALRFADRDRSDNHYEPSEVEGALHAERRDRDTLDPARMPYEFARRIPGEYLWALGRAWGGRPYPVQDRFGKYIKEVKGEWGGGEEGWR